MLFFIRVFFLIIFTKYFIQLNSKLLNGISVRFIKLDVTCTFMVTLIYFKLLYNYYLLFVSYIFILFILLLLLLLFNIWYADLMTNFFIKINYTFLEYNFSWFLWLIFFIKFVIYIVCPVVYYGDYNS